MPIQQTDERLFKGTTAEILAFVPPTFTGFTYAESTTDHTGYRWNSTTLVWEPFPGAGSAPSNPTFFVSNTGSDSNAGTALSPLATPQEALKRLGASGWTGFPFIFLVNTINMGATPKLMVPAPVGGAGVITIQGLLDAGVAVTGTGGTAGSVGPPAGGTVTGAAPGALNADKGKILRRTSSASSGLRFIIDANTAGPGGTYTVPAIFSNAPINGDTYTVFDFVGKLTWSGLLLGEGPVAMDQVEFLPTVAGSAVVWVNGHYQETACRWTTVATFVISTRESNWASNNWTSLAFSQGSTLLSVLLFNSPGLTPCGSRYNGIGGVITIGGEGFGIGSAGGAVSGRFVWGSCSFEACDFLSASAGGTGFFIGIESILTTCGIFVRLAQGGQFRLANVIMTGCRATAGGSGAAVACQGGQLWISQLNITGTLAGNDLVSVTDGTNGQIGGMVGANALANAPLRIRLGAAIDIATGNTATGSTAGSDVVTDVPSPTLTPSLSWAQAAVAVEIGASRGTWTYSTDNSAAPSHASTVNKLSGRESLAIGGSAIFTITNSLAKGGVNGDACFIQLEFRDATAVAPIAVVTDGIITITFLAAATANTAFSWWLKKSGVS